MSSSSPVLAAELPARWGRWQRLKNGLIYRVVRLAYEALARVPLALLWPLATLLGTVAYVVDRPDRRRALSQLAAAMPSLSPRERKTIVRGMFVHLARSAVEATHLDTLFSGKRAVRLSAEQRAIIDAALAHGRGVVAVGGHIGNWELLAQLFAAEGYPVTGIAKPLYDP
ncbi:MAG: hypothetical protein AAB426_05935, partial [Myxococcota bacterium]